MKKLIVIVAVCLSAKGFAQIQITPVVEIQSDTAYTKVNKGALFPGGDDAMMKFISENIKYPADEKKKGIEGTCYLQFVVEKNGTITDVKVLKGVTKGPGCDAEALRIIKAMPKWTPAQKYGGAVREQLNMPIKFTLK